MSPFTQKNPAGAGELVAALRKILRMKGLWYNHPDDLLEILARNLAVVDEFAPGSAELKRAARRISRDVLELRKGLIAEDDLLHAPGPDTDTDPDGERS